MIAGWMVRIALMTALLGVAALAAERVVVLTGGSRRRVWLVALLAVLMLPLLAWVMPGVVPAQGLLAGVRRLFYGSGVPAPAAAWTEPHAADATGSLLLAGAWLLAVLVSAVVYGAGWWKLRRARRTWRPAQFAGSAVLVARRAGPAAVGLVRPAIVVPEWLLNARDRVRRLVFLHEAEHVRAGDHAVRALAPLVLVTMPWNLPLWWMLRRLRLALEVDCDRRVLARGVAPETYGSLLIDVAGRSRFSFPSVAFAAPRSGLERRLLALAAERPKHIATRAWLLAGGAMLAGLMACAVLPPDGGASDNAVYVDEPGTVAIAKPAELRLKVRSPGFFDSGDEVVAQAEASAPLQFEAKAFRKVAPGSAVRVYVDGRRVDSNSVSELDPDRIDRVEVVKGPKASASTPDGATAPNGVILIYTKRRPAPQPRGSLLQRLFGGFCFLLCPAEPSRSARPMARTTPFPSTRAGPPVLMAPRPDMDTPAPTPVPGTAAAPGPLRFDVELTSPLASIPVAVTPSEFTITIASPTGRVYAAAPAAARRSSAWSGWVKWLPFRVTKPEPRTEQRIGFPLLRLQAPTVEVVAPRTVVTGKMMRVKTAPQPLYRLEAITVTGTRARLDSKDATGRR